MAYDVKFTVPSSTLGSSDIAFVIKSKGAILGTLEISKGSLVWFQKGRTNGHKVGWKKFSEIAKTFPRKEVKKSPRRAVKKRIDSA